MAKENTMNVNNELITLGAGYIISAPIIPSTKNAVREESEEEDIYADEEVLGEDQDEVSQEELADEFEDDC